MTLTEIELRTLYTACRIARLADAFPFGHALHFNTHERAQISRTQKKIAHAHARALGLASHGAVRSIAGEEDEHADGC